MTAPADPLPSPPPRSWPEKWRAFRTFLNRAWSLSLPYFQGDDRWMGRGLLVAIIALNLGAVYMLVLLNEWNRAFYDALQNKNEAVFWKELWRFLQLAFVYIIIAVYRFYLTQLLEMRWRRWLTHSFTSRWLQHQAFYHLELARFGKASQTPADNPDQRIQEDLNLFTSYTVSLSMGLLNAVVTLVSFVGILWSLSGDFSFTWNGDTASIPGFMVWMAVLYAAVGSVLSHYIGRPLMPLNYMQQRREADYRHLLIRTREFSDAIALDHGQRWQVRDLGQRFHLVLTNYLALIRAQKRLTWFTVGFGQLAVVFPFVVAAPRFFSGAIQLGELMQISSAFGRVQDALSWFVDNYASLASWRATTDRLTHFEDALRQAESHGVNAHAGRTSVSALTEQASPPSNSEAWQMTNLQVCLPQGQTLGQPQTRSLCPGDSVWIQGPSGCGKSTLLRTLAGIWPWYSGELIIPEGARSAAQFIPQRPYFPNGTLRQALLYPQADEAYGDVQLLDALTQAELSHLSDMLDEEGVWNQRLSGGEQQRLALARVFLRQPMWLFLDEATSALDEEMERTIYDRLLRDAAQRGATVVSVAHRSSVGEIHQIQWRLKGVNEHI